jgi:dipeptidase D
MTIIDSYLHENRCKGIVRLPGLLAVGVVTLACAAVGEVPSERSQSIASYAVETYGEVAIETLGELLEFETYHQEDPAYPENPEFRSMVAYLEAKAEEFGFDFADHGAIIIIGLGEGPDRIGVVAHGDVQQADATKWANDPFTLDTESEPGRLVGRGTEDDKGPLACALYAMKAIKDRGLPLGRRIELIIALTEEFDWAPIREFLKTWEPPQINVAFDANYPVVTAEKGWGEIHVTLSHVGTPKSDRPTLESFSGGSFLSQIPEDGTAIVLNPTVELEKALRQAAASDSDVDFSFRRETHEAAGETRLIVEAHGAAAHSAQPWDGRNALTHLAALLGDFDWPETTAAQVVKLSNDLIGLGDYAEKFGDLAQLHPVGGRLTLTLAVVKAVEEPLAGLKADITFRRPKGRTKEETEASIAKVLEEWRESAGAGGMTYEMTIFNPYMVENAPHVPVLLDVFRHYTGIEDAAPVAIGGGTNASLLPNGVSFGPSMPGESYTGHSEHEFISRDQLLLNLEMYTAALADLAGR